MSLETDVQELTQATTDLLVAVNVSKATLDGKVDDAGDFATASLNSANASAASAATATTQATAAGTARTGAETARDAAVVAQNNAVAVVTGGTATLTPSATKIPLSDAQGKIAKGWLTNTDLVEQTDIGTAPNEIPLNQYLGEMAYMDANTIPTIGVSTANLATANVTNLQQVTEISTVMPTLNLDFAKVKQLDPRITFTRASTGTYYDGKTVAKAEENLLTFSQDFDNAAWLKNSGSSVLANTAIAPDGTLTADTLSFSADSISRLERIGVSNATGTYTFSVWMRVASGSYVVNIRAGVGVVTTPVTVTTTWQRFSSTDTLAGVNSQPVIMNSAATTADIFIWGAQLEQRASATAYTPTTTQPVTNYIPVLLTAASGVPRFDHNPITGESLGLLIKEQRTNLLTYSEQFDNAAWTKSGSTITANAVAAPDGTLTADAVIETATTAQHSIVRLPGVGVATYTYSFFAKANGRTEIQVEQESGGNSRFTLTGNGTAVAIGSNTVSITAVGNGWYRCTTTFTATGAFGIYTHLYNGTSTSYAGNGFSGVYIWGAQLEAGAFPTSYIPTVASQVTRAADSASMTGANFSSWYRQDEGTVFIENNYNFGSAANSGSRIALQLDNGSSNDRFVLSNGGQANSLVAQVGSVLQAYYDGAPHTANFVKTAFGYATNNMAVSNSGSIPATDTSCLVPIVNTMRIGMFSNGALQLNGTIKKLTYYPQRLSNAELVEMTA